MATMKVSDVSSGRARTITVQRALIAEVYAGTASYGPCPHRPGGPGNISKGGVSMSALLGPDLGDGQRRGTPTNSNSLQPLMGILNAHSSKTWIAGHLLNADLGGSGIQDQNLTPLTSAANAAHKVFEAHIKRMLLLCNQLDRNNVDHTHWYGVHYRVVVANVPYAAAPNPADMHSYCPSHITLNYRFVCLPKFGAGGVPAPAGASVPVAANDRFLAQLQNVVRPNPAPSANVAQFAVLGGLGIEFSVEIHNEP